MAKEKNATANPFFRQLFHLGVYKRSQGRIARQITFAAFAVVCLLGAFSLSQFEDGAGPVREFWIPCIIGIVGLWIAYRLVNMPSFADFLIAVEAEMNKVSWPSRAELMRSSLVVIFSIFFLAAVLFGYDLFWRGVLTMLGVIRGG